MYESQRRIQSQQGCRGGGWAAERACCALSGPTVMAAMQTNLAQHLAALQVGPGTGGLWSCWKRRSGTAVATAAI
jgi:hypothetical protein